MSIYAIKPKFQQLLSPIKLFCINNSITPTMLNTSGVVFSTLAGVVLLFSNNYPLLNLSIPVLVLARTATNALDGMVARETGVDSKWGIYLNELFDRVSDLILFTLIVISGHGLVALSSTMLAMSVLVTFTGVLTQTAGGKRNNLGIMGKPDRMFVIGAIAVGDLLGIPNIWNIGLAIMVVGGMATVITRVKASYKELNHDTNN